MMKYILIKTYYFNNIKNQYKNNNLKNYQMTK